MAYGYGGYGRGGYGGDYPIFSGLWDFFYRIDLASFLVFLLIFAIIYAVLQKTKIMGEERRNINIIIAVVVSLIAVLPHFYGYYTTYFGFDIVEIISAALPGVSLIVVAVIMMLILVGLFAHDKLMFGVTMPGWIAFFSIIAIIFIFGSAAEWWYPGFFYGMHSWGITSEAVSVVIMFLVFGVIIAFITSEGERDKKMGAFERIGFNMKDLFGGKR